MFKCPHCGKPLPVKSKLNLAPSNPITCTQCNNNLKPFKVFYYGTFFAAPAVMSLLVNRCEFSELSAAVLAFGVAFLLFICQPIAKA